MRSFVSIFCIIFLAINVVKKKNVSSSLPFYYYSSFVHLKNSLYSLYALFLFYYNMSLNFSFPQRSATANMAGRSNNNNNSNAQALLESAN
jgi:hypothetical protein